MPLMKEMHKRRWRGSRQQATIAGFQFPQSLLLFQADADVCMQINTTKHNQIA